MTEKEIAEIKLRLLVRGFEMKTITSKSGLIEAVIDETILILSKKKRND